MWIKTRTAVRGQDKWGNGAYRAPRGKDKNGKKKTHRGVDLVSPYRAIVLCIARGKITKIGYPYDPQDKKKGHLRYIQVTDEQGRDVRYFYVEPLVEVGDSVRAGSELGACADLTAIWPKMINHVHLEVKRAGRFLSPVKYLAEHGFPEKFNALAERIEALEKAREIIS